MARHCCCFLLRLHIQAKGAGVRAGVQSVHKNDHTRGFNDSCNQVDWPFAFAALLNQHGFWAELVLSVIGTYLTIETLFACWRNIAVAKSIFNHFVSASWWQVRSAHVYSSNSLFLIPLSQSSGLRGLFLMYWRCPWSISSAYPVL